MQYKILLLLLIVAVAYSQDDDRKKYKPKPEEPKLELHKDIMTRCHPSCYCEREGKFCAECNICTRCKQPDAAHIVNQDFCQCNTPQYRLIEGSDWECEKIDLGVPVSECEWYLFNQIYNMVVHSKCSVVKDVLGHTFVQDILTYDWRRLKFQIDEPCKCQLVTRILWAKDCVNYVPLNTDYYNRVDYNQTVIKIPLIDVYDLANFTLLTEDGRTIYQRICFAIELGHSRRVIREHRFQMRVYTNRDQVEIFHLTVSKQITEGCDFGQECIIVANLDTLGRICTDLACNTFFDKGFVPEYIVGEHFYARIQFKDNTYLKYLTVVAIKFSDDAGIYIYQRGVQWWTLRQGLGFTDVDVILFQPQCHAFIEVTLKIAQEPDKRLLSVGPEEGEEVVQTFQIEVKEKL